MLVPPSPPFRQIFSGNVTELYEPLKRKFRPKKRPEILGAFLKVSPLFPDFWSYPVIEASEFYIQKVSSFFKSMSEGRS